jgi:two-component system cell cycle response regulator
MRRDVTSGRYTRVGFKYAAYVLLGVVGLLFADALLHVSPADWSDAIHNYGFMAVSACSAVVVFGRVALVKHNRRGWLLFAIGLGLLSSGDFYYTTIVVPQADPPFPTFADVLYLAGYPVLTLGLAVLLASRLNRPAPSMWLDAGIGVSAVLMISVGLLLGALTVTTGTTLQVVVALAYPLADFVLIAMIAAVIALTGARLDRALIAVVLAVLAISIADVVFFYETTLGTWSDSNPIGLLWPLGGALFAIAAWSRDPRTKVVPLTGMRAVALPSIFAAAIIGYGLVSHPPRVAEIIGSVGVILLVARMLVGVRENARLVDRLRLDPLTGLGNRGSLSTDLARGIAFGRTSTLVLADLDGFKLYNDAFGHPAGDAMLRRLSTALSDAVGPTHAYRIGGDEFCILLDGDLAATEEAREGIAGALSEHGEGFKVGVSLGTAQVPGESADPEEAIQIADQRMYATKDTRRDDRRSHDALAVLINAQRARQPELGDHVDGVAELAEAVGKSMGLLPGEVTMLRRAAELHDIGKIAIPDTILQKPGPLTDEEWEFMRQHTILGERILRSADSLAPVARIVRSTHERYDGDGYPDGLAGEEIPLAGRIILACDAFNAMTFGRPYAAPMSKKEGIAELRRCSGSDFDPEVVSVLCAFLEGIEEGVPAISAATRQSVLIPST